MTAPEPESDGVIQLPNRRSLMPALAALSSAGFDVAVVRRGRHPAVTVPAEDEEEARAELHAVARANRGWPPKENATRDHVSESGSKENAWFASALSALALAAIFAALGPYDPALPLMERTANAAQNVRDGEWWRVFTAMTLHADFAHLLSNVIAVVFLGTAACRLCGWGGGWLLIVLAGAAANTITALTVDDPLFRSLGASTATFGALGILTGAQTMRKYLHYKNMRTLWHPALVALLAGTALLGILGTGPQSDLRGHLYGFLAGLPLGAGASIAKFANVKEIGQAALFAVAWGLIGAGWAAAVGVSVGF